MKRAAPYWDISRLENIGPKRETELRKAGINTVLDLCKYFPKEYIPTEPSLIYEKDLDTKNHYSLILTTSPSSYRSRGGKKILKFTAIDDKGTKVNILYFNQPYLKNSFIKGKRIEFYGEIKKKNNELFMVSPEINFQIDPYSKYTPVYNPIGSISAKTVRKIIFDNLYACAREVEENLSPIILNEYSIPMIHIAIVLIHYPVCQEDIDATRKRFAIEKLIEFSLELSRFESNRKVLKMPGLASYSLKPFEKILPFTLTKAQKKVISQITRRICSQSFVPAINRLIQGDVGSGKTIVAAAISYIIANNKKSTIIMAPTEVLAFQHYKTFSNIFDKFGIPVYLLTGSTSKKEVRKIEEITSKFDSVYILIGTHALISDSRIYRNVALTITDEQQRFGTIQRASLNQKCEDCHSLVMTATPIPRSLAIFLNTENSISVIDAMPEGRKGIKTVYVGYDKMPRIYNFIKEKIAKNQKAYFVCPMLEPNDELMGIISAKEQFEECKKAFPDLKIGFINGKMKNDEKNGIMEDFKHGDTSILVATTVIEVGIDVPEASVIVIMNAERLGLSQLHQLRGRVGRGTETGYCVLVSSSSSKNVRKRLSMLCSTSDGFEIAEYDLKMRGPGEFFGTQQSGFISLPFTDILDQKTIISVIDLIRDNYKPSYRIQPFQPLPNELPKI